MVYSPGLFLYDHLGGRKNCGTRTLDLLRDPEGAPILDSFHKGFEYSDCWVDDARTVTLNAVDAAERGTILTRTRCVAAERKAGAGNTLQNTQTGEQHRVRAKALVNASGPWVLDIINDVTRSHSKRSVRW